MGSGQMRREGRQSCQQMLVWFIHVSFLGPEAYDEGEPALIELVWGFLWLLGKRTRIC